MKLDEAFECFERSIQDECKPPDMSSKEWTLQKSKTYDRLAELHKEVHDHENAEKYFRLAMDLDGKNLEAGVNFMGFLRSFGRLEESFAFFDEVYGDVAAPQNVLAAQSYLFDKNYISSDKEAAEKLYLDSVRFGKALEAECAPHKIAHHRFFLYFYARQAELGALEDHAEKELELGCAEHNYYVSIVA